MKGTPFEFASAVDAQIESLTDSDYRMHNGRAKRLLEELLPISRLALLLKQPGLQVEVQAFEDSGPTDGNIKITGFREQVFDVQVVCDFTYEERLRMELMHSDGCAPGSGKIWRDQKAGKIIAETAAVDSDAHYSTKAEVIRRLAAKKARRDLTANTVLIVGFEELRISGLREWIRLIDVVDNGGGLPRGRFVDVYLFNNANSEIHRA